MSTVCLVEQLAAPAIKGRIDLEANTLHGVCILRETSQAGRRLYLEEAMQDLASIVNDTGLPSFEDHRVSREEPRPMSSYLGSFHGARVVSEPAGLVVRAELHYRPERRGLFEHLAASGGKNVGFSISAVGQVEERDGKQVVLRIKSVESVDLVSSTGSTLGLFESAPIGKDPGEWEARYLRELTAGRAWRRA